MEILTRIILIGHRSFQLLSTVMIAKLQSYVAILLSVVYLAETLVVGVAHYHSDLGCAHSPVASHGHHEQPDPHACHGSHKHDAHTHACSCPQEHADSESSENPKPTRAPCHDDDNCPVCRFLAERSLHVDEGRLPHASDDVELLNAPRPVLYVASYRLAHYSRGPPA